jgi:carbamate kinase
MKEDAGRGWRRVVASPKPVRIVEIDSVKQLWEDNIVITCGGGGILVVERMDGHMEGVAAVIDKDFAAELLAEMMEVDTLMILTEVEKVAINFNKPDQQNLDHMTLEEAEKHCADGQFAPGSMLPKVKAAMKFVTAFPEKKAIITSLDKAIDALNEKTGTVVTFK